MAEIIINAANGSFGRICSYAAKQALEGNEIIVVNSEKSVISGNKKDIIKKYGAMVSRGGKAQKGPKYIKIPYRMLKRGIRGMLPDYREGIGKQAFVKIKCYNGIPEEFKDKTKEMENIQGPRHNKFITLKELSEKI